jgi:hypothetical protein
MMESVQNELTRILKTFLRANPQLYLFEQHPHTLGNKISLNFLLRLSLAI